MPIYEYRCKCGCEKEELLLVEDRNKPQTCKCGETMLLKFSVPCLTLSLRFTAEGKAFQGRDMALDSLNSKSGGFPQGRFKAGAQKRVAAGLDSHRRVIGRGF